MYIVINKITNQSAIIKEKTQLAKHISVSYSTVQRNKQADVWETDQFIIYKPQIILLKSNRGGTNPENLFK